MCTAATAVLICCIIVIVHMYGVYNDGVTPAAVLPTYIPGYRSTAAASFENGLGGDPAFLRTVKRTPRGVLKGTQRGDLF